MAFVGCGVGVSGEGRCSGESSVSPIVVVLNLSSRRSNRVVGTIVPALVDLKFGSSSPLFGALVESLSVILGIRRFRLNKAALPGRFEVVFPFFRPTCFISSAFKSFVSTYPSIFSIGSPNPSRLPLNLDFVAFYTQNPLHAPSFRF